MATCSSASRRIPLLRRSGAFGFLRGWLWSSGRKARVSASRRRGECTISDESRGILGSSPSASARLPPWPPTWSAASTVCLQAEPEGKDLVESVALHHLSRGCSDVDLIHGELGHDL